MAADDLQADPKLPLALDAAPAGAASEGYVVVARRYRPQTFTELIGQEHVARALSGAIAANRVGHAYLFTGARGVGKTSAARILAKALNCEQGPTATPCNRCDICQSISAGSDVDVLEIDGASNRGIDEIRQLRQNVNIRPSRARFKIYIIDEVHMLTREAFNALLKTLEEPPEHVKFIFCTTEAGKIPITILSRCQRFDFAGIQQGSIVERLAQIVTAEGVTAEPEALQLLARRANGSMRDSQSLLEQLLSFGEQQITAADVHAMLGTAGEARLASLVQRLANREPAAAIAEFDAALGEGVEVGQLVEQLLGYFRDLMATLVGCTPEVLLHTSPSEQKNLAEVGKQLGLETILAIMQILDHTLARLRYSTQTRTLAEMALVRIANLADLDELGELIAELRTGASGAPPAAPAARSAAIPPRTASYGQAETAKKKADLTSGDAPDAEPEESTGDADGHHAPRTPAAGQPLSAETVELVWKEALATMSDMVSDTAAQAESVRLVGNNRLRATFNKKFAASFCEHPANLAKLTAALSEAAGTPVTVEFAVVEGGAEPAPKPKAAVAPRQRMAEKADHPLVRRAGELFDARLVRVETPDETSN